MDFDQHLTLGALASPFSNHDAITLNQNHVAEYWCMLRDMVLIRTVENKLAWARESGLIGGPVHLGVGQEAIAVGVSKHLQKTDKIFGAHRSHAHIIALGSDVHRLFAEILGRNTGLVRGMGGSMHLWDETVGFSGSVPIVAGTVALAVGAALAAKIQSKDDVAIAYLGDGACEEGVVHESLNLASVQKNPVIFVVENNLFASHMHISKRQPSNSTARFALANHIPFEIVDGNNVVDVANAAEKFINRARSGEGPGFIEAVTYRWYGHVDWREDVDVGVNRSQIDIAAWRKKDPVERLKNGLADLIEDLEEQYQAMLLDVQQLIDFAWERAMDDPFPEMVDLEKRVYSVE